MFLSIFILVDLLLFFAAVWCFFSATPSPFVSLLNSLQINQNDGTFLYAIFIQPSKFAIGNTWNICVKWVFEQSGRCDQLGMVCGVHTRNIFWNQGRKRADHGHWQWEGNSFTRNYKLLILLLLVLLNEWPDRNGFDDGQAKHIVKMTHACMAMWSMNNNSSSSSSSIDSLYVYIFMFHFLVFFSARLLLIICRAIRQYNYGLMNVYRLFAFPWHDKFHYVAAALGYPLVT